MGQHSAYKVQLLVLVLAVFFVLFFFVKNASAYLLDCSTGSVNQGSCSNSQKPPNTFYPSNSNGIASCQYLQDYYNKPPFNLNVTAICLNKCAYGQAPFTGIKCYPFEFTLPGNLCNRKTPSVWNPDDGYCGAADQDFPGVDVFCCEYHTCIETGPRDSGCIPNSPGSCTGTQTVTYICPENISKNTTQSCPVKTEGGPYYGTCTITNQTTCTGTQSIGYDCQSPTSRSCSNSVKVPGTETGTKTCIACNFSVKNYYNCDGTTYRGTTESYDPNCSHLCDITITPKPIECLSDSDCADGNPCTADPCDLNTNTCLPHTNVTDKTVCSHDVYNNENGWCCTNINDGKSYCGSDSLCNTGGGGTPIPTPTPYIDDSTCTNDANGYMQYSLKTKDNAWKPCGTYECHPDWWWPSGCGPADQLGIHGNIDWYEPIKYVCADGSTPFWHVNWGHFYCSVPVDSTHIYGVELATAAPPVLIATHSGGAGGQGSCGTDRCDTGNEKVDVFYGSTNIAPKPLCTYRTYNDCNPGNTCVQSDGVNSCPNGGPNCFCKKPLTISGGVFMDNDKDGIKDDGDGDAYIAIDYTVASTQGNAQYSTSGGKRSYTIPGLSEGVPHTLTFTTTSGYTITYPPLTLGNSATVTVGTNCSTLANHGSCSDGSIINLDMGVTDQREAWFQSKGSDMRVDRGFIDPLPSATTYASIPRVTGEMPGIIFSGAASPVLGGADRQVSANPYGWQVGDPVYPDLFTTNHPSIPTSYNSLQDAVETKGITTAGITDPGNCVLDSFGSGVYTVGTKDADQNLTINASTIPANRNLTILVKGNLTIAGDITVSTGSTAIFSASGNITVDAGVRKIDGFYSADGNFTVSGASNCSAGTKDAALDIQGTAVANAKRLAGGTFTNNRTLCEENSTTPSVTFTERPDFMLNYYSSSLVRKTARIWREVAP